MQRINLSTSGPEFSRFVVGWWRLVAWKMSVSAVQRHIEACLELGVTSHDHADIYGDYTCEALFGKALGAMTSVREKIEIVSKCGIQLVSANRPQHKLKSYNTSSRHIIDSAEQSLKNLQTEYLDCLLIHRPDPLMNADEMAEAFDVLKNSGKVRHFGVSNFTPWQFDLLQSRLDYPLVTNQVEISVLRLDAFLDGTLDQCQQDQIAPMAWSSLAGGRLFRDEDETAIRVKKRLQSIGHRLGASVDQVALAWLLFHPANIVPVVGSQSIERVKSALDSLAIQLTREDWYAIWEASSGCEVP